MRCKTILIAAALFSITSAFAQGSTEYRLWSSVGYQWKPTEDLKLTHAFLYRELTGLETDRYIFESELDKKSGNWDYSAELRYYFNHDEFGAVQGFDQRGRIRLLAERSYKDIQGTFKMRYAIQHREIYLGGGSRKTDFRVRAAYEMGIKDFGWDPEFQIEYLGTLTGDYNKRLRVGFDCGDNFGKTALGLGYFYERNLSNTGFHYHSITASYTFKSYK
jgi:hypothetical protein